MPRTSGPKTKAKILRSAEALFARKGIDATSVDAIAKAAGVNKALIYYHFKNKQDLVAALIAGVLNELEALPEPPGGGGTRHPQAEIRAELAHLGQRRRLLGVMWMESLKGTGQNDFLFQCAELAFERGHHRPGAQVGKTVRTRERCRELVDEFFTGFVPMLAFLTLRDRWCDYFECDPGEAEEFFLAAFARSHLDRQA